MSKETPKTGKNEGEGNRTAAREYNSGVKQHIDAGKVEPAAEQAKKAVDSPEGDKLREAEKKGESKARH